MVALQHQESKGYGESSNLLKPGVIFSGRVTGYMIIHQLPLIEVLIKFVLCASCQHKEINAE